MGKEFFGANLIKVLLSLQLLIPGASFAHGPEVQLPVYFFCEQTSNHNNGWVIQHLFIYQKNDRGLHGKLLNGVYHRAEVHPLKPNTWFKSTDSEGKATLSESESPFGRSFNLSAIGYNSKMGSNLPSFVVSARIELDTKSIITDITDSGIGYQSSEYEASCKMMSEEEAKKAFRLVTIAVPATIRQLGN